MPLNDWNNSVQGRADAAVLAGLPVPFQVVLGESVPRAFASLDAVAVLGTGVMRITAIPLQYGVPVSTLTFFSDSVAGTSTLTVWAALYYTAGTTLTLAAQSASGNAYNWPANTRTDFALSSSFTPPYTGIYYAGIMVSSGGQTPTLTAMGQPTSVTGINPIRTATVGTNLAGSAPATITSMTAVANVPYCFAF